MLAEFLTFYLFIFISYQIHLSRTILLTWVLRRNVSLHVFSNTDGRDPRRGEKGKEDILHASSSQGSNYFEIPTKEGHMANNGIHEIPTKDTDGNVAHASTGESLVLFTLMYHRGKKCHSW